MAKVLSLVEAQNNLRMLVDDISENNTWVIIQKRGKEKIVIISAEEYLRSVVPVDPLFQESRTNAFLNKTNLIPESEIEIEINMLKLVNKVIDTAVLVSAFLKPSISHLSIIVDMVVAQIHQLFVMENIVKEWRSVLHREKCKLLDELLDTFFKRCLEVNVRVTPETFHIPCAGPKYNIFLKAAFTGKCEYLITGNISHSSTICSFMHI